ncbi:L-threonylcarbamoyladenylate synthase [Curvivirga sp.]|uniref:L-threonylcarbamoyladenylate synthase n=1 Tax=Curvivirga sp. TaxID=2856848 RepID=UPI003B59BFA1
MTEIHKLDDKGIAKAAKLLRKGETVSFPTETVYGLGADATSDTAVAKIYTAKGRPSFNPLIVHVPNIKSIERYATLSPMGQKLADAFWPGALTLVLKLKSNSKISKLVSAGLDTVAIRMPAHGGARDLLRVSDLPIAAPSANASGKLSPSEASHVKQSLDGRIPLILDGGSCAVGLESTIVDVSGDQPTLLRPGGVAAESIEAILGCKLLRSDSDDTAPKSPGMLSSHYAPVSKIRLNAEDVEDNETLIGFGNVLDAKFNLSESGDTTEAAANLFRILHEADKVASGKIAISPIPNDGLGLAINDRLKRAAAPRPNE